MSVPGGWAVWEDESARQVFPPAHWDLRFCIAFCALGPKAVLLLMTLMLILPLVWILHSEWVRAL